MSRPPKSARVARVMAWQAARIAAGLCRRCGEESATAQCWRCAKADRENQRAKHRAAVGIPLDAPLRPGGRRRVHVKLPQSPRASAASEQHRAERTENPGRRRDDTARCANC